MKIQEWCHVQNREQYHVPAKQVVTPLKSEDSPSTSGICRYLQRGSDKNYMKSTKCKKILSAIQTYHMDLRKRDDIAYN